MIPMQVVSLLFSIVLSVLPVTLASGDEGVPHYTGDEFNELFATAPLERLREAGSTPEITGDKEVDFCPNEMVTRSQLLTLLERALQFSPLE